jgi:hypothetical protein
VKAPVRGTREKENCRGRNRRDEASTAAAEQTAIQSGAAFVALVVLIGLAVDTKFAVRIDAVVDEDAFLAGKSLKTPAQQK